MKRTWMPRAACILCIIAGVFIVVIPVIVVAVNFVGLLEPSPMDGYGVLLFFLFVAPWTILLIILGTVAIVGGIYALRRKNWGLALAGSICALPAGLILGILAIIFVIKGKGEFKAKALVSAYYKRGDAYDETREYDKAITSYSNAIELDPNHALSYYNRGCAYGEIGEYEKAIADFNKAVELDPNDANAYYNRGLAYHEKGEAPEAVNDLEKCIGLSTDPERTKAAQQALRKAKKSL